jgi:hypothetical protein
VSKPEFSTPLYKLPAREKRKRIERSEAARAGHERQRQRHVERLARAANGGAGPPLDATPELADAWHRLQLHWVGVIPGYRECVRLKLTVALALESERYGVCSGCGGDLSPTRYTAGCDQCQSRRRTRSRRAAERLSPVVRDLQERQSTRDDRLEGLTGY